MVYSLKSGGLRQPNWGQNTTEEAKAKHVWCYYRILSSFRNKIIN